MGNFKAIWMSFKICTIFILIALIKLLFSGYAVHIFLHNFLFYFYWSDYNKIFVTFLFLFRWIGIALDLDLMPRRTRNKWNVYMYWESRCAKWIFIIYLLQISQQHSILFLYSFCFTYWLQISQFNIYGISWFAIALPFPKFRSHFINNWTLWFNVDFYNIINYLGLSHFGGLSWKKNNHKVQKQKTLSL